MKNRVLTLFTVIFCFAGAAISQNVGINVTGATPHPAAALDVVSTTRGVLIPRMTEAQRTAISPVTPGLLVYQTNNKNGFWYHDGSNWTLLLPEYGGWNIFGNGNTTPGTHFVGTTDNQHLDFRTNNTLKLRLTTKGQLDVQNTGGSIFIGYQAGDNDDLSLNKNVFIGDGTGRWNTTGEYNVGLGAGALTANSIGNYNTAIGTGALLSNTSGILNNAIGANAMYNNSTGSQNTAMGISSLLNNSTGTANCGVGHMALSQNTSGGGNIGMGFQAGDNITTGSYNIVIGYQVDVPNPSGNRQMSLGNLIYAQGLDGTGPIVSTGNVGIGTNAPDNSAILDLGGFGKGLLIPRMSQFQRNSIASPATSLLVYQTDNTPGFYYYDGSSWTGIRDEDWTVGTDTLFNSKNTAVSNNIVTGNINMRGGGSFSTHSIKLDFENQFSTDTGFVFRTGSLNGAYFGTLGASAGTALHAESSSGTAFYAVGSSQFDGSLTVDGNASIIGGGIGVSGGATVGSGIYCLKHLELGDTLGTGPFNAGTVMYEAGDFQGYDGTNWVSLTAASVHPWTESGGDIYRSTGRVGIGTTPSAPYTLDIEGMTRVSPPSASADFLFGNIGIEPSFLPSATNYGYIGSSTSRVYQGHFSNLTVYGTFTNLSDRRIKENVQPLSSPLEKILQLTGKQYDLKRDFIGITAETNEEKKKELEESRKNKIGFIAQEVESVFPELVQYDEASGLKSVDYIGVIPVLVEAVKEQHKMIETLEEEVEKNRELEERIERLEQLLNNENK